MSLSDSNLALADLALRVQDWKGHNLGSFGQLLLHDTICVTNSDISQRTGRPRGPRNVGATEPP
jgi:hypothetical protein